MTGRFIALLVALGSLVAGQEPGGHWTAADRPELRDLAGIDRRVRHGDELALAAARGLREFHARNLERFGELLTGLERTRVVAAIDSLVGLESLLEPGREVEDDRKFPGLGWSLAYLEASERMAAAGADLGRLARLAAKEGARPTAPGGDESTGEQVLLAGGADRSTALLVYGMHPVEVWLDLYRMELDAARREVARAEKSNDRPALERALDLLARRERELREEEESLSADIDRYAIEPRYSYLYEVHIGLAIEAAEDLLRVLADHGGGRIDILSAWPHLGDEVVRRLALLGHRAVHLGRPGSPMPIPAFGADTYRRLTVREDISALEHYLMTRGRTLRAVWEFGHGDPTLERIVEVGSGRPLEFHETWLHLHGDPFPPPLPRDVVDSLAEDLGKHFSQHDVDRERAIRAGAVSIPPARIRAACELGGARPDVLFAHNCHSENGLGADTWQARSLALTWLRSVELRTIRRWQVEADRPRSRHHVETGDGPAHPGCLCQDR